MWAWVRAVFERALVRGRDKNSEGRRETNVAALCVLSVFFFWLVVRVMPLLPARGACACRSKLYFVSVGGCITTSSGTDGEVIF